LNKDGWSRLVWLTRVIQNSKKLANFVGVALTSIDSGTFRFEQSGALSSKVDVQG